MNKCGIDIKNNKNTSHYCKHLKKVNRIVRESNAQSTNEKIVYVNNKLIYPMLNQMKNIKNDESSEEDEIKEFSDYKGFLSDFRALCL